MQKKYTISLIGITISILCLFVIYTRYRIYKSLNNEATAVTVMSDDLSINFLHGNPITIKNSTILEFSVTNYSSKKLFYSIRFNSLSGNSSNMTYDLTSEDFTSMNHPFEDIAMARHEIKEGATERYTLKVNNPEDEEFTFEIQVEMDRMNHEFQNLLLSTETKSDKDIVFQDKVNQNGLFHRVEQQGDLYYYRGNVENNYVTFANHMWRIVKINEDGSIKLVLSSNTENMVSMTREDEPTNDFFETQVYSTLDSWYQTHLQEFDQYISSTKYCYDNGVLEENGDNLTYLSVNRIFTDYLPTNVCNGTSITSKIALLTVDEVMYAGAKEKEEKDFYLYDAGIQAGWWTMTPSKKSATSISYISVNTDGSLAKETEGTKKLFVRPVITLNKKVKMIGEGTKENPYHLE